MMYRADYRNAVMKKRDQEKAQAEKEREIQEKIDLARAKATLMVAPPGKMRVLDIISQVAKIHGLTPEDIIGRSRRRHIVIARKDAMQMAHNLRPDLSFPQLGRIFVRCHTTVLYACGKVKKKWNKKTT